MKILIRITVVIVFLLSANGFANTCTSSAGSFASWAALTWTCTGTPTGGPPGCGDRINIAAGTVVQISADVDYSGCASGIDLHIYGVVNFPVGGVRFKLPAGSSVTVELGGAITKTFVGGGSSTLISVGGENVWTAGDGPVVGPITLPIDLLSFTATPNEPVVELKWSTATETNNDFFTLERSADGINFQEIATIDGAGTVTSVHNYGFIDQQPIRGVSYYRLRQTDYNGMEGIFPMIEVNFDPQLDFSFTLSPNPNHGDLLSVIVAGDPETSLGLVIYDLTGRPVYTQKLIIGASGNGKQTLDFGGVVLPAGAYMVSVNSARRSQYAKMIVN